MQYSKEEIDREKSEHFEKELAAVQEEVKKEWECPSDRIIIHTDKNKGRVFTAKRKCFRCHGRGIAKAGFKSNREKKCGCVRMDYLKEEDKEKEQGNAASALKQAESKF